jgi:fumarate hydratase class II
MMPMMAHNLLESIRLLTGAACVFADRCVAGIEANEPRCAELIEGSLAMCTSLAPLIGYDKAAAIAKEAYETGKTVRQIAKEKNVVSDAELDKALDPTSMTKPS